MDRRNFLTAMATLGSTFGQRRLLASMSDLAGYDSAPAGVSASAQSNTIRQAAAKFLETLSPGDRSKVVLEFPAGQTPKMVELPAPMPNFKFTAEQYGESRWTNFPASDVPRPGLRMGTLTSTQVDAVHGLLRATLSSWGYQKVHDIMAADQILEDAGQHYAAGYAAYTIGLFGQPSPTQPWMLQFGGHHLGLNVIFAGSQAVCAPLHMGILPAKYREGSRTVRALGREHDKAFELLGTLTPAQHKAAVIDHNIDLLVFGPGHPDATLTPVGVLGSDLDDAQRSLLFQVAYEWAGVLHESFTAQRLKDIRDALPQTRFAWSGDTTHQPNENGAAYFRIHGPSLLIEFAPQPIQGGPKEHVHTIMRDLHNDYARQLLTKA